VSYLQPGDSTGTQMKNNFQHYKNIIAIHTNRNGTSIMPTVWNTHLERQTLDHLVNTAIMLLDTELSDSSSSISNDMDVSFDTVLDLLDDDDDDDDDDSMDSENESTIGAAIKQVVEYRTMMYGEAQGEKRVYGEDYIIQDLPDCTQQEFRFRKHYLQTVAHLVKKIPYHGRQLR
jgi:hypothetical protein